MLQIESNYKNIIDSSIDLSPQKELELINEARHGNIQSKSDLFSAYLKLVFGIAKNYHIQTLNLTDLIHEGVLGLEDALKRFEPERGYRFATVARWWVKAHILKYIRSNIRMFDVPTGTSGKIFAINKSIEKISKEQSHAPTNKEIGLDLNLNESKVSFLRKFLNPSVSINATIENDNGSTNEIQDLLFDDRDNGRESLIRNDGIKKIRLAINKLSPIQRIIIQYRYGLNGKERTLKQVSNKLFKLKITPKPLTIERIRQIQNQSEEKLKALIDK